MPGSQGRRLPLHGRVGPLNRCMPVGRPSVGHCVCGAPVAGGPRPASRQPVADVLSSSTVL